MHTVVLGFARSGKSVANHLLSKQEKIVLTDAGKIEDKEQWIEKGVRVVEGEHPLSLLDDCKQIIKNPGIPYHIPFLQEAKKRNIPIYTEVELAYQALQVPIIGITGSNGKTTVTHLIYEMLQREGKKTIMAGNIGLPLVETIGKELDVIVCELSSFQLMGIQRFRPHISIITNITPSHLDYHESEAEYREAKFRIQENQTESDYFICNAKVPLPESGLNPIVNRLVFSSEETTRVHTSVRQGRIFFGDEEVMKVTDIQVAGVHNLENYLTAITAVKVMGVSNQSIKAVASSFQGVAYRLEKVLAYQGVEVFNDSKSTNTEAAAVALNSFSSAESIRWIGGGKDRGDDFEALFAPFPSLQKVYVYGETKEKLKEAAQKFHIEVFCADDLETVTEKCFQETKKGEKVVFSPACASWDQYRNFEIRGTRFNECVEKYKTYLD